MHLCPSLHIVRGPRLAARTHILGSCGLMEELGSTQTKISHKAHGGGQQRDGRIPFRRVQRTYGGFHTVASRRTRQRLRLEISFVQELARTSINYMTVPRGRWMTGDTS